MGYELLDSGDGKKLERVGEYILIRPAAGAVWQKSLPESVWQKADSEFDRLSSRDGLWKKLKRPLPDEWIISLNSQKLLIKPTDFGHLGLFAEQQDNWQRITDLVVKHLTSENDCQVLNLFAYTGGSTIAALKGGASLVHLDASKTSVEWAKQNIQLNELQDRPVRYIVDDATKFVQREAKRQKFYHGIILDPPSYGRGNKGQIWKIEDDLCNLLDQLKIILAKNFSFILLSAHSQGYTPIALKNLLIQKFGKSELLQYECGEMLINPKRENDDLKFPLPSGAYCFLTRKK